MPNIVAEKPVWTVADAEAVSFFLASPSGRRLIDGLLYRKPEYTTFSCAEKRLVESGIGEGYDKALAELVSLSSSKSATS